MTTRTSNITKVSVTDASTQGLAALTASQADMEGLDAPDAGLATLNVWNACAVIMAAWTLILPYRKQIATGLPIIDIAKIDSLPRLALATDYVNNVCDATTPEVETTGPLYLSASARRDATVREVKVLVDRGILPASVLKKVTQGAGYQAVSQDLGICAAALQAAQKKVVGKSAFTAQEIADLGALATELSVASRKRKQKSKQRELVVIRAKLVTLLAGAYAEATRAIACIRYYEGDAGQITPSMYVVPATKKKGDSQPPAASPTSPGAPPTETPPASAPALGSRADGARV